METFDSCREKEGEAAGPKPGAGAEGAERPGDEAHALRCADQTLQAVQRASETLIREGQDTASLWGSAQGAQPDAKPEEARQTQGSRPASSQCQGQERQRQATPD